MSFGEWLARIAIASGLLGAAVFAWAVMMWIAAKRGSPEDKAGDRVGCVGLSLLALSLVSVVVGVFIWWR